MKMTQASFTTEVIKLLSEGFCTGAYARNNAGRKVEPDSPKATHFCVLGACIRVTGDNRGKSENCRSMAFAFLRRLEKITYQAGWIYSSEFNDRSTQKEVIDFLKAKFKHNLTNRRG